MPDLDRFNRSFGMAQNFKELDPEILGFHLQTVRKARGLTQQEVADRLNIARTTLTAIEKGERIIRADELFMLAQLYQEPVNRLLRLVSSPREAASEPFLVQFRKALSQTENPEIENVIREFQKICEDYLYLENLTNSPLRKKYPPQEEIGPLDPVKRAEDIAIAERNRLGLGDNPVGEIKKILENEVGIRIFAMPLPSKIAGLFAYTEQLGACMATNSRHPQDRQLMTLMHEYAHFLTSRTKADMVVLQVYRRVPASERFADAFARFFLMPASSLQRRFHEIKKLKNGSITPADLLELADMYSISFQALLLRLEEIQLLPGRTWDKLVHTRGFQVREAQHLLGIAPKGRSSSIELPYRFKALAITAWNGDQLSEGELTQILRTDRVRVREIIERFIDRNEVSNQGEESSITFDNLNQPLDEIAKK